MQGFIFDMDGVIIDSEPIHSTVKMDTFRHFDIPFEERELVNYMGRTSRALFEEVLEREKRTDIDIEAITKYKHDHYFEVLEHGDIGPVEGSVELIHALHTAGIPLGLATSSNRHVIRIVIDRFGLEDCFQSVISGGDLPASKPDPEIFVRCAAQLAIPVSKYTETYVIEDSYNGIRAAHAAGMKPVMVPDQLPPTQEMREKAVAILPSLMDVMEWMEGSDLGRQMPVDTFKFGKASVMKE